MTNPILGNIKRAQEEYLIMIKQYKSLFEKKKILVKDLAYILDEIKCFWLERLGVIEFELEDLTEQKSCFLLSGAVYLNVADYEHYYFKSLGNYHLLPDPFLKMESFFIVPEEAINSEEIVDYFKNIYVDTIEILTKYKNCFFILPIREMAIDNEKEHFELLNTFLLRFISSILDKEFLNREDFCNSYKSYEEIEKDMDSYTCEHLLYNEADGTNISLRKKIERYGKSMINFEILSVNKQESELFLISTFSFISQIAEILWICTYLNVNPYIRYDVTFNYLILLMGVFIEDKSLKGFIEKAIIFYILRNTIKEEWFKNIEFSNFCRFVESKSLLNVIISKMRELKIDICKGGIKEVQTIILNEFSVTA